MKQEMLEGYIETWRKAEEKMKQKSTGISILRLILFLLALLGLLLALAARQWWGWLLAGGASLGFVVLVLRHMELENIQKTLEHLIWVYDRYRLRLQGKWQEFEDTGTEFPEKQDFVSADLDVFGTASLYQMICVAHTSVGRRRLAEVLRQGNVPVGVLEQRQAAVRELAEKSRSFSLGFEALALALKEEKTDWSDRNAEGKPREEEAEKEAEKEAEDKRGFSGILRVLSLLYPLCFLLSIIGAILTWWGSEVILVLFFGALLFSWIMTGYCQRKVGSIYQQSGRMKTYLYMMDALASAVLEADVLKELQQVIAGQEGEKDNLLKGGAKLERLLALYNIRYNPIVHWLLSGICLYDFHLAAYAVTWKRQYGSRLEKGIEAIGEVEMLSSLAVLERIHKVTYPSFGRDALPAFSMEQVYHPLLKAETAVANDISMKQGTVVITGSNMSGKTTFLRTIGLNLVIAYAGGAVCAEHFSTTRMRIFTSMRVVDDVQHGISTFYAEILRIKEMIEYGTGGQPMLCLIDEIFKGTNSADRIVGAEVVIRKLTGDYIITIVSTHDFELCKLADNYHFEEEYRENQIYFDYKLKQGNCTTTNALYLLKMAGLTE